MVRRALAARGNKFVDQTPEHDLSRMEEYFDRAMPDLIASLQMTPKPIVTLYNMYLAVMFLGESQDQLKILTAADQIDPKNFIVRYKHLSALQARRGGSLQKMLDFREQCKASGMPDDLLKYFDELIDEERKCACAP